MTATRSLLFVVALLAGCADMPQRHVPEASAAAAAGRAAGRIHYLEDGKEFAWSTSWLSTETLTLFVRDAARGSMQFMEIEGDGRFLWTLAPGEYDILGYQVVRRRAGTSRSTGRVMARFTVPQAGRTAYIGDLRIEAGPRGLRLSVAEGAGASGEPEVANALMRLEGDDLGGARRVLGICTPAWGLACDRTTRGVVPVEPVGTADSFPVTEDRRPLLKWTPSSRTDVTYDVAVYESLSFMYGANGNVSRMRGARVAYAEGLAAAQFRLAEPLPPGRKFEWTVRLRAGDTVSSWSTTSYARFLIVAAASGQGQSFGFETPPK
jgi:hypothetical protein